MMRPDNRVEVGGISSAVSDIYDPQFVKAVFDRCSNRYITFSLICSFGFTERWRQQCVAAMPALPLRDARGYDPWRDSRYTTFENYCRGVLNCGQRCT